MAGNKENDDHFSNRPVRNLDGLLKFCTEVTAYEDRTKETSLSELPVTQERRQFLEDVLQGMFGDAAKCMADCLKILRDGLHGTTPDVSEQESSLDQLSELAEDVNYAIDLEKMNGLPILLDVLTCPHPSLQKGAAQVLGDICQNNEKCQKSVLALDAMPKFFSIIDSHESPECKIKALYALSCLIREYKPAEKQFCDLSGFRYLIRAIKTKIPKLVIKAVFLLDYFINRNDEHKDTLLSMGYVEELVYLLYSESIDDITREHCSNSLLNLCMSYEKAIEEALRPEFKLLCHLQERQDVISGKEQFQDEYDHVTALIKLLEDSEDKTQEQMLR